ncbi:SDR family oxidoreductase [Streptomyces sp. NPDC050619]|uniref:SDR family NAD(P)-dependent oxidoreductase n=1 Tax=Streptomyces sp. NPDC050619 TaxID=3157214 RepID=UPI00342F69C8
MSHTLVIGGSQGLGRHIAEHFAKEGGRVTLTSRDASKAEKVAAEIGGAVTGLAVDLSRPESIEQALAPVKTVDQLVITAIEQAANSLLSFSVEDALRAVTAKVVGYLEAVHTLTPRFAPGASIVLFGGLAKERPYPGSTVVTAVNGAVSALVRTLAVELAPIRVNALHPSLVGDSPQWRDRPQPPQVTRTPIGRPVTMAEVTDATVFLLRNTGVNAVDLYLDGGLMVS